MPRPADALENLDTAIEKAIERARHSGLTATEVVEELRRIADKLEGEAADE
jgi:hypothetical protein